MLKLFFVAIALFGSFSKADEPVLSKEDAMSAFTYLNKIRTNPANFIQAFPFLKDMKSMPALRWNDTLARVAEARALDLAKRNYFAHVDPDGFGVNHYMNKAGYKLPEAWLKEPGANYFESLGAGSISGMNAVDNLIIDANTPSLGHRKHLLGMTDWDASLVDIGIGYVKSTSSTYPTYACIIIAKHNW